MADTAEEAAWRAQYDEMAIEDVRKRAESRRTASSERTFALRYLGEEYNARRKADRARFINEGIMARWTRILGKFTIVLASVSFVSAVIAALTALILFWTDETSRLRDRALLYFGNPPIAPYPPSDPLIWGVGINIENSGSMSARRVTIRYACPNSAITEQVTDTFALVKAKEWRFAQIASVVGPKQVITLQGCEIPVALINDAKKSARRVFYLVEAKYLDGFDLQTVRVTQMSRSFALDQWGGQSLGFTTSHNCSDDDCPK